MANTQTAVPLFVANAILTAQQQNLSAGTGVPVFATTVTRDAAFGGSNKALAEGQLCYLESTNVTQQYNGSSWETVGPTVATPSGLVYITGAAFTSQTTVSMAAGTFTSTYKNYTVILDVTTGGSGDSEVTFRVNNAGSPRTGANYYAARTRVSSGGTQTVTGYSAATSAGLIVGSGTSGDGVTIQVYDPTNASQYTIWSGLGGFQGSSNFGGQYFVQESTDGVTFIFAASSTGFYRVYGYSES
jgi:hypothetical protein